MSLTFDQRKAIQAYQMPMQRTSCSNCALRMAHHMQCGRGGFYVQAFGVCKLHEPMQLDPAPTTQQAPREAA